MPKKLAESISIDYKNSELRIDGEVFPYHLVDEPVIGKTIDREPVVTITIPAVCVERHW